MVKNYNKRVANKKITGDKYVNKRTFLFVRDSRAAWFGKIALSNWTTITFNEKNFPIAFHPLDS